MALLKKKKKKNQPQTCDVGQTRAPPVPPGRQGALAQAAAGAGRRGGAAHTSRARPPAPLQGGGAARSRLPVP